MSSNDIKSMESFVWLIAELLRGDFKQSEYGKFILPFVVLHRQMISSGRWPHPQSAQMPLLSHPVELKQRLLHSLLAVVVLFVPLYFYANELTCSPLRR